MDLKLKKLKEHQDQLFFELSNILSAMSAPVRLKLVHFLTQAPLTVEVLSRKIDQSVANTSMHLRKMLAVKVVKVEHLGQKRLYSLHPAFLKFWEYSQDFVQTISPDLKLPIDQIYSSFNWDKNLDETKILLKNEEVIFLDVRPEDEVEEIISSKNYLHIPSSHLEKSITTLPSDKVILVFCRGRMCALSAHSVQILRNYHINAYRIEQPWFVLKEFLINGG